MKTLKFLYGLGKRLSKKNEKVANSKNEEGYSISDRVEPTEETQESSSISLGISNNAVKNSELSRPKPAFLSECEWILSKLAKAGKLYNRENFFQILQKNYSNEFKGPLDFKKVESKLIQARLLTKTVSEYLSSKSKPTNSSDEYCSDSNSICKIGKYSFLNRSFKDMVTSLTERERDILFKRYFVKNSQSLKTVGQYYGITRERVRQIEGKALLKLKEKGLHKLFAYGLLKLGAPSILRAEHFVVINENLKIPLQNPLGLVAIVSKIIGNKTSFNYYPIEGNFIYLQYKDYPPISKLNIKKWIDKPQIPKEEFKDYLINEEFYFLTEYEFELLYNYYSEQHEQCCSKSHLLKNLIVRSLKLIGCPAHYSDITEKVREIGEKYRNYSYNSIHSALNRYNEFVWVGKRGVHGLKEWGLSPPDKSLEDQIYSILKDSGKPLSKESIAIELSKKRPYFSEPSLNLILGKSDQIIKIPDNLYRIANKEDIEVKRVKKAQTDKMSNAMEEILGEWEKQKNSE